MKIDFQSLGGIFDLRSGEHWPPVRLEAEVRKRAGAFAKRAIGPGHIVAVCHGGTPAFFADLLALWSVGASAACLNPKLTPGELANIVAFAGVTAILVKKGAVV